MESRKYIGNKYQKVILTQIFPPGHRSVIIPLLLRHSFTAQILPAGVVMVVRVWRLADRRGLLHVSPSLSVLPLEVPVSRPYRFLPTAATALPAHLKNGYVDKPAALPAIAAGLAGTALAAWVATALDVTLLRRFFGAFLLYIGVTELFRRAPKESDSETDIPPGSA